MFMPEPSPTPTAPLEFPGGRAAVRLGLALLAGLALALFMVARDEARRGSLETVAEATGVGDTKYARRPEKPVEASGALVTLQGEALFAASRKSHGKRDTDMRRVARDEATGLTIYEETRRKKTDAEGTLPRAYFLKLAPGQYLELRTRQPSR